METDEPLQEARRLRLGAMEPALFPIKNPAATVQVALATEQEAPRVHALMQEAFAAIVEPMDPPSGSLRETVADVVAAMRLGGAVLVRAEGEPVASGRFLLEADHLSVGRLAVRPSWQGRGIAAAMLDYLESIARNVGYHKVRLGVRMHMPRNVALYQWRGYEIVEVTQHPRGNDQLGWMVKQLSHEEAERDDQ